MVAYLAWDSQVLSDADMKIVVGPPPDQQEGQVGAPKIREAGRISGHFIEELVGHLPKGTSSSVARREILVHDRDKNYRSAPCAYRS